MRFGLGIAAVVVALSAPVQAAQKVAFPYEAVVESPDAYVRSGPGSKYYPTTKLRQGATVVVHRHDPGGWHMIAPPPGSFSWVLARNVERSGDRGTVKVNNVIVRVGSFESDIREFFQRKLAAGDEVQILGEKKLLPESGSRPAELWYRIAPPRGEWRWIAGQALSPPPRAPERSGAPEPFRKPEKLHEDRSAPSTAKDEFDDEFVAPLPPAIESDYLRNDEAPRNQATVDDQPDALRDRPVVRRQGRSADTRGDERAAARRLAAQLEALDRLDARLRSILEGAPEGWDFSQLERDYRRLRAEAESATIEQRIDARLTRIDRARRSQAEAAQLAGLAAETQRRDAELANLQRQHEARFTALRQPRYEGAGILERAALSAAGSPRYALVDRSGKVLAYVSPGPGLNLEPWLGRPVGVNGARVPRPDLQSELITVTHISPVRLAD